jgi:hypothetical protein
VWPLFALVVCAAGCMKVSDPCPTGMVEQGRRCVRQADTDTSAATPASPEVTPGKPGDGGDADTVLELVDAGLLEAGDRQQSDAQGMEAGAVDDAQVGLTADAPPDLEADARADVAVDAQAYVDADAQQPEDAAQLPDTSVDGADPVACPAQDLAKWRAFEMSSQINRAIVDCYWADPACAEGTCNMGDCLRGAGSVAGCKACADQEAACVWSRCGSHCRSSETSDLCRACACRERCIGTQSSCAMGPSDICSDCEGDVCSLVSMDPSLIMRVLEQYPPAAQLP